jgi:hypothetical protein
MCGEIMSNNSRNWILETPPRRSNDWHASATSAIESHHSTKLSRRCTSPSLSKRKPHGFVMEEASRHHSNTNDENSRPCMTDDNEIAFYNGNANNAATKAVDTTTFVHPLPLQDCLQHKQQQQMKWALHPRWTEKAHEFHHSKLSHDSPSLDRHYHCRSESSEAFDSTSSYSKTAHEDSDLRHPSTQASHSQVFPSPPSKKSRHSYTSQLPMKLRGMQVYHAAQLGFHPLPVDSEHMAEHVLGTSFSLLNVMPCMPLLEE